RDPSYGPSSLYFFFQAEDGIRDGHVTGVQTCALPISAALRRVEAVMTQAFRDAFAVAGLAPPAPPEPQQDERQREAEERGVELPHAHCLSTSEASGARPGPPTFFACGAPYSPLSAGSAPQ